MEAKNKDSSFFILYSSLKKKIAITGGIGSGKSYVCRMLAEQGIEVYDCDHAAKVLMNSSAALRQQLTQLIGDNAYLPDGRLNKAVVAQFLLKSDANKTAINNVVHPAVAADFENSGKQWLESAILFESGFDKRIDFTHVICVTAPLEVRIDRICSRDSISRQEAQQWIDKQMSQEEKAARSNFVIDNDGKKDLITQINIIVNKLNSD